MRFRYLRIAFSATCLIACVLLIALWVRSYGRAEMIESDLNNPTTNNSIRSSFGQLTFAHKSEIHSTPTIWFAVSVSTDVVADSPKFDFVSYKGTPRDRYSWPVFVVYVPHWFAVLLVAASATLPWISWRFSLRTLLIATTLIAVVLGLAVWATKR
jgi:hypothetical protein